ERWDSRGVRGESRISVEEEMKRFDGAVEGSKDVVDVRRVGVDMMRTEVDERNCS
ncbi:hypothetical protein Tco_0098462, partial [Tanacetum coccineum]